MICSICGSGSIRVYRNDFVFLKLYEKFSFIKCNDCGHVLILPPQSDPKNGQEYIREYTNFSTSQNKSVLSRVKNILSSVRLNKSVSIFDIGSGNCQYGMAFTQLGFRCFAVDVERLNPSYSPFVYSQDLDIVLDEEQCCFFFSNHSFEHIESSSLKKVLDIISKKMNDGSSCLFVLPSPKKFLINCGIFLEEFVYGHNNLFSENSARIFFKEYLHLSGLHSIEIFSPRVRFAFLKTRLEIVKVYIARHCFKKAIILMCYIILSAILGSNEEIWVRVNRVET